MPFIEFPVADLAPISWGLSEEVQDLRAATAKFARERLEPLLRQPPDPTTWSKTVRLAAALELGRMILPEGQGGMTISQHDLALVTEQFAAGPLERAAELTLSSAALMTLREYDALGCLPGQDINEYSDGTISVTLGIPDVDGAGVWLLRQHPASPVLTFQANEHHADLVVAAPGANWQSPDSAPVVLLGALSLGRYSLPASEHLLVVRPDANGGSNEPVRRWLINVALYLAALLSGALQQSATFALSYSISRQAFRKPLASHQLVASRIADLVIAAHSAHLFLRSAATSTAQYPQVQTTAVCQMAHHIALEAMDASRDLVQLCGGHGYVEGLPPAARFQTMHWFAMLLMKVQTHLNAFTANM